MEFEIKHRWSGKVLFSLVCGSLKLCVEAAVKSGADLGGADLRGADLGGAYLRGADLRGAYLRGADLGGAYLGGADLRGADLRGADLRGADLRGADLRGAEINWQSHALIAEILCRNAGDDIDRRKIAGLIAISTDWCWDRFLATDTTPELRTWALETLAMYVQDGDDSPKAVRAMAAKKEPQETAAT